METQNRVDSNTHESPEQRRKAAKLSCKINQAKGKGSNINLNVDKFSNYKDLASVTSDTFVKPEGHVTVKSLVGAHASKYQLIPTKDVNMLQKETNFKKVLMKN